MLLVRGVFSQFTVDNALEGCVKLAGSLERAGQDQQGIIQQWMGLTCKCSVATILQITYMYRGKE